LNQRAYRFGQLQFVGFRAAHIFPLAWEDRWTASNMSGYIRIPPTRPSDGMIDSVQNGVLLSASVYDFFYTFTS